MRDSDGANNASSSSYFYPELPPREIFVNSAPSSNDGSTSKHPVASSVMMVQKESSFEQHPKARFFTFEGLTPVSTVDDSREDRAEDAGRDDGSPQLLSVKEQPAENRVQPCSSSSLRLLNHDTNHDVDDGTAPQPVVPKQRCWSLTLEEEEEEEEVPFDEDPITQQHHQKAMPHSCPNAALFSSSSPSHLFKNATPVKRMAPVNESPAEQAPDRVDSLSDVSEEASVEHDNNNSNRFTEEERANPQQPASIPTKTVPSSLFDNADDDDDEDDGIIQEEDHFEALVMAPSDELEDRKRIEAYILREAEATDGCDVDICKHLVNSSNDICQGFAKLMSI